MISVHLNGLKETKPHEYLMRFAFGGVACVLAGLVADRFGPAIGGLFLAFPAIFPASATLLESHEKEKMAEAGKDGSKIGRREAGIDAAGTAIGCVGLGGFALCLTGLLPHHHAGISLIAAVGVWAGLSFGLWIVNRSWLG